MGAIYLIYATSPSFRIFPPMYIASHIQLGRYFRYIPQPGNFKLDYQSELINIKDTVIKT